MNTDEVASLVKNINGRVFSLDNLPQIKVEAPYFCIYNVLYDNDKSITGHWIGIAINEHREIYHCDPLGLGAVCKEAVNFININFERVLICNKHPLQSEKSQNCGLYCVLFLHAIALGKKYSDFLAQFDIINLDANDIKVKKLLEQMSLNKFDI